MLKSFDEILECARTSGEKNIAVAAANDLNTLATFAIAQKGKLAKGILVGDREKIEAIASEHGIDLAGQEIVHVPDDKEAAAKAVALVKEGKADVLMKGMVKTGTFLKAILDSEKGLRSGDLLSHVLVFEDKANDKLVLLTDGGINIRPSAKEKAGIIRNAVRLFEALGGTNPKVAALAAVENVNEKMPETVDAHKLQEMNESGELTGCQVQGPLALDNAISAEAAKIKGLTGPVVGQADILLVPDIAAGNLVGKMLIYYAKYKTAGAVVGATAPIVFLSRADDEATKLNSIALGLSVADKLA